MRYKKILITGGAGFVGSRLELTKHCQEISGRKVKIDSVKPTRLGDIRWYISDYTKIRKKTDWKPKKNINQTLVDIYKWLIKNKDELKTIFS